MLRTSSLNLFYWLLGTYGELLTFKMVTGYCFQCVCAQITKVEVGEEDLLYLAFWTLLCKCSEFFCIVTMKKEKE